MEMSSDTFPVARSPQKVRRPTDAERRQQLAIKLQQRKKAENPAELVARLRQITNILGDPQLPFDTLDDWSNSGGYDTRSDTNFALKI